MAINRDELEEMRSCFKTCEIVNWRKGHSAAALLYNKVELYLRILIKVEEIAREAFGTEEEKSKREDELHKLQALANIHALFIYDGKTLKENNEDGD